MSKHEEVKQRIREAQNAARDVAKAFIRKGLNRWIEISLREGWSYNLEEHARSIAYSQWVKTSRLPTLSELDEYRVPQDDHKYFKNHGRAHTQVDLRDIIAARQLLPKARNITGDA